jgi:hypothetical protein
MSDSAKRTMQTAPKIAAAATAELRSAATGRVTVDLTQIAKNWQNLVSLVGPAECGAVVKANAYGLGAQRVIPALVHAGCKTFFIATPEEAAEARRLAPEARILPSTACCRIPPKLSPRCALPLCSRPARMSKPGRALAQSAANACLPGCISTAG